MRKTVPVLSQDQINFYGTNGYLVVSDVVTRERCDELLAIFRKYADSSFAGIMNLDRGGHLIHEPDARAVRAVMTDPAIVAILETLQQSEIWVLQSMFLFKQAGSPYASQAWNPHQDNAYPQAAWGAYLTANIPFEDQDPENGGMYIYPGSHREPLLPHEEVRSFHEEPGKNPGHRVLVPEGYEKVDLRLSKGSVLVLHGNVIHGSYPNHSPTRSRPMLLIPYIVKGAAFLPGQVAKRTPIPVR